MPEKKYKAKKKYRMVKLVPNALVVKIDGEDVYVPVDRMENLICNALLTAQFRSILQRQIKKYNDGDVTMSPKEVADLIRAGAQFIESSGVVYAGDIKLPKPGEKSVQKLEETADIDFNQLKKPILPENPPAGLNVIEVEVVEKAEQPKE